MHLEFVKNYKLDTFLTRLNYPTTNKAPVQHSKLSQLVRRRPATGNAPPGRGIDERATSNSRSKRPPCRHWRPFFWAFSLFWNFHHQKRAGLFMLDNDWHTHTHPFCTPRGVVTLPFPGCVPGIAENMAPNRVRVRVMCAVESWNPGLVRWTGHSGTNLGKIASIKIRKTVFLITWLWINDKLSCWNW